MKPNNNVTNELLEFIKAVPNIPYKTRGKKFTSKCICGGTITAMRSSYNGHLHAYCDKCERKLME